MRIAAAVPRIGVTSLGGGRGLLSSSVSETDQAGSPGSTAGVRRGLQASWPLLVWVATGSRNSGRAPSEVPRGWVAHPEVRVATEKASQEFWAGGAGGGEVTAQSSRFLLVGGRGGG